MLNQKVFVNRILNMKKIKLIGLDMDHTLVRYYTENLESLVFQMTLDKLIAVKNYPEQIKEFKFNFQDAIRGLVIDCENGNILKLSRFGAIRYSYHGTKKIDYSEQKQIYRSIYVDLGDPNYMAIDTSFSIAFCVLYGQLVDLKDKYQDELPNYQTLASDLQYCVDRVHAEGELKKQIADDLPRFVITEKKQVEGLKRYIHYGKKFFILTNSDYHYTNQILNYAINPFLEEGETWHDLFEYVFTMANKPRFFYDNLRFLKIDQQDGKMTNLRGPIVPGVYQGGNANKITDDLQINGDEILYIGDHIYGDILRLKKDCNWRTALVVEELGVEIASQKKAFPVEKQIVQYMDIKTTLEEQYVDIVSHHIEEGTQKQVDDINDLQQHIAEVDSKISDLLKQQHSFYNLKWDRVFRAGAEESYFAYQVDCFACIYMEKLSDLLEHSPLTYFRANRRLLAHDIDVNMLKENV